jgi:hypothetical protein
MTERSSFVTDYCYCATCFSAARSVLLGTDKYLCSQVIDGWKSDDGTIIDVPIIAGKIGGLGIGDDVATMMELAISLQKILCHKLRIAMLPDSREYTIFSLQPGRDDGEVDMVRYGQIDE